MLAGRFRLPGTPSRTKQPRLPPRGNINLRLEGLESLVQGELETASQAMTQAYDEIIVKWFKRTQKIWPVRTGFSRGQLQLTFRQIDSTLLIKLENLASYAGYIRQRWMPKPHVVKRLIWDPSKNIGERMLDRVASHIADEGI